MSKTIIIIGFGPGVSTAMAEKFGAAGFSVALVARGDDRLAAGAAALTAKGIAAAWFPCDAANPTAVRDAIRQARSRFGPITVIHWNAFAGGNAGDLLTTDDAVVQRLFDVAIFGLLSAVQETFDDLKSSNEGAVLVTNGALGEMNAQMDGYACSMKAMGVGLANAAKDKLVGLLSQRLKGEGVYVGQVTIAGTVAGTPFDHGKSIEPSTIAATFWDLYQGRDEVRARLA